MSRVNRNHRTAPFLGLVLDKTLELRERPRVDPPLRFGLAPHPRPCADVFKVFQHERSARLDRAHDLLGQHMIAITPEAPLPMAQAFEVPLGTAAALLLRRLLELEQPSLDCLPGAFTQEAVSGRHCQAAQSQVDADHLLGGRDLRGKNTHDDVQPPAPVARDQVGRVDRVARILRRIVGNRKANRLPPVDEGQPHRAAFPIQAKGVQIIARRAGIGAGLTDRATSLLECQSALDGLSWHPEGTRCAPGYPDR